MMKRVKKKSNAFLSAGIVVLLPTCVLPFILKSVYDQTIKQQINETQAYPVSTYVS